MDRPNNPDLFVDAILDVLSHEHRREILQWIRDQPEQTADEQELVAHLIDYEEERNDKLPHPDHLKASLHHVHQPKLDNLDILTYAEGEQEFAYQEHPVLEEWLDMITDELPDGDTTEE